MYVTLLLFSSYLTTNILGYLENYNFVFEDYKEIMDGYKLLQKEIMEYDAKQNEKNKYMYNLEEISINNPYYLLSFNNDKLIPFSYSFDA